MTVSKSKPVPDERKYTVGGRTITGFDNACACAGAIFDICGIVVAVVEQAAPDTGPSPEQLAALERFAARQGRDWKYALNIVWMNGSYGNIGDDSAYLQQIRNNFGPQWLETYEQQGRRV